MHVAVPVEVVYFPASQITHWLSSLCSEAAVAASERYLPTSHEVQVELAGVDANVPEGQTRHWLENL